MQWQFCFNFDFVVKMVHFSVTNYVFLLKKWHCDSFSISSIQCIIEQSVNNPLHLEFTFLIGKIDSYSHVTSAKELETTSTFSMLNLHCLSRLKTAINLHQNLCGHLHVHLIFWNDHSNKPLKTRTFKEISGLPWVSLTADLFFFWNNNKYHLYRACLDTQGHWPEKHCIPAKTTWAHWVIGGLQNN